MNRRKLSQPRHSLDQLPLTINVETLAELLGMSRSAAYRAVAGGHIKAFRVGCRWHVPTAPLKELLGL